MGDWEWLVDIGKAIYAAAGLVGVLLFVDLVFEKWRRIEDFKLRELDRKQAVSEAAARVAAFDKTADALEGVKVIIARMEGILTVMAGNGGRR
jgi:hypothetical protein